MQVDLDGVALVAGGALEIHTVGKNLPPALLQQNPRAQLSPARGVAQAWEEGAGVEQAERLAGEVRVGRVRSRQVPFHVRGVRPDGGEHLREQPVRERRRAPEQTEGPAPGDQAQGRLQAARPVDSDPLRVGLEPVAHVKRERLAEAVVPRETERLPQADHPLVTVELPDHLAVPDRPGIERIDQAPVDQRGASPRDRVQVPVHGIAERETAVPEQIEAPLPEI